LRFDKLPKYLVAVLVQNLSVVHQNQSIVRRLHLLVCQQTIQLVNTTVLGHAEFDIPLRGVVLTCRLQSLTHAAKPSHVANLWQSSGCCVPVEDRPCATKPTYSSDIGRLKT